MPASSGSAYGTSAGIPAADRAAMRPFTQSVSGDAVGLERSSFSLSETSAEEWSERGPTSFMA